MTASARDAANPAVRIETAVARLLTWGTRAALLLVAIGVLGMATSGVQPLTVADFPPYSLAAIPGQILELRPEGFIWAGLTLLVALPVGRVVVSGAGFLAAGDRRLVLISVTVLIVIGASIAAALRLEA